MIFSQQVVPRRLLQDGCWALVLFMVMEFTFPTKKLPWQLRLEPASCTVQLGLFVAVAYFSIKGKAGVSLALGTDIGVRSSLSPFATMKAAYEIALWGISLSPEALFYAGWVVPSH